MEKFLKEVQEAENRRWERADHYLKIREAAEKKAEDNRALAHQQEGFSALYFSFLGLDIAYAIAETEGDCKWAKKTRKKQEALKEKMKKILQPLGLTFEELRPKRLCSKCSDTGFTDAGKMCDCYFNS